MIIDKDLIAECCAIIDELDSVDLGSPPIKWVTRGELLELFPRDEAYDDHIIKLLCGGTRPKDPVKMKNEDERPYYRRFGKKF